MPQKRVDTCTTSVTATDALVGQLAGLKVGQRRFWLEVRAPEHKLIAVYLDVAGLCRVDSAMTGVEERREWQKALKGLHSVALNKWPRYSNLDRFAGLRWCVMRRIELRGIKIERIVMPGYGEVPRKDHFSALCELGFKDIAKLMVVSNSIGLNSKDAEGQTPTLHAAYYGYIEIVFALIQAGADLNQARDDGATPLFIACQEGHVEVVYALFQTGADLNQAMDNGATPLCVVCYKGHLKVVHALIQAGADLNQAMNNAKGYYTPLSIAHDGGYVEVVKLLEAAGALSVIY